MMGKEYIVISNGAESIFSKFNTESEKCIVRVVEELQDGGDAVRMKDKLKCKITQNSQWIEPKGIDKYEVMDYIRYFLISNNLAYPVCIEQHNRRYQMNKTSNIMAGKEEHFDDFIKETRDIVLLRNIFEYFVNYDLSNYKERRIITTDYGRTTKLLHMQDTDRFLINLLYYLYLGKELNACIKYKSDYFLHPRSCFNIFKEWYQNENNKRCNIKYKTFLCRINTLLPENSKVHKTGASKNSNTRAWKIDNEKNIKTKPLFLKLAKTICNEDKFTFESMDLDPNNIKNGDEFHNINLNGEGESNDGIVYANDYDGLDSGLNN